MPLFVDSEKCNGCGLCLSVCQVQAISLLEKKAFIDRNKCNECLLCMDECLNNAIYIFTEKEVYVRQREYPISASSNRTVPHARPISLNSGTKQPAAERRRTFLDIFKKAMDIFFNIDSSFGISKKGITRKSQRQRRRHRGGKF